jgi:hypothetical protein
MENYSKIGIKEIGWTSVEWINLYQDREKSQSVVHTAMNLRIQSNVGNVFNL